MTSTIVPDHEEQDVMQLELADGYVCQGFSFGAKKSVSGECVFSTGLVGYPESLTDPSYRGQILILTFPLIGNYGVPSRKTQDGLLEDLPAFFEASQIHVAGLITASYSGENYSHFLASSSLGTWLKENNVPAMHGVDTRAITKRIREKGSMLGRISIQDEPTTNGYTTDHPVTYLTNGEAKDAQNSNRFSQVAMSDQSQTNLVAMGMASLSL